jgi:hypothetical protein
MKQEAHGGASKENGGSNPQQQAIGWRGVSKENKVRRHHAAIPGRKWKRGGRQEATLSKNKLSENRLLPTRARSM